MLGSIGDLQPTDCSWFHSDGHKYELEVTPPEAPDINYYDYDWEDKVLKVNDMTPKPGIVDFFIALAHKTNSPLIKAASLGLNPPYKSAVDIVECDKKNGYIFVANRPENALTQTT